MTLLEKIKNYKWFDSPNKLRAILEELYNSIGGGSGGETQIRTVKSIDPNLVVTQTDDEIQLDLNIPAIVPQVKTDWNAVSGLSQLLNKPEFKSINGNSIVGNGDITINTFNGYSIIFDGDNAPYWYNGQFSLGNGNELSAWNATDSSINWPQTPNGQSETLALSVNNKFADNNGNISLSSITTTFTTNDGKTVTVTNGVITNIQ